MPVYNEEELLAQSLESFFGQTIASQCELICIDDGSTDRSVEILASYAQKYSSGMKVLKQSNQGSGRARNAGIDGAEGEFIGFLDSDDLYPCDSTLATLYAAAKEHDVCVAGGSLMIYDGGKEYTSFATIQGFEGHEFLKPGLIEYRDYQFDYGYQRFIYNREFLRHHCLRFPGYLRYQDPPFFVRTMLTAQRFYAVAEPTYKYCPKTNPVQWNIRKLADMIEAMTEVGILAAEHDLEKLFELNFLRFDSDWYPIYRQMLIEGEGASVLDALFRAKYAMRSAKTNLDVERILNDSPSVLKDVAMACRDIAYYEQLQNENATLKIEVDRWAAEHERTVGFYVQQQEDIFSSKTWKSGRAVLWLPRTIRDLGKGRRK
jgi:glycosyltransferase involved in cell wall biosynthesis